MNQDSLFWNKLGAAVLCAGLLAMGSGFVASILYQRDHLEQHAFQIGGGGGEVAAATEEAPAGPEPIEDLLASADLDKGAKLAKKCTACHSFEQGGPNKTGPNLWGVVGNDKGQVGGFAYSDALTSSEGPWSYASLNHFLWKPKDYMTGTKMNFAGFKKTGDRANIIAWMREQDDAPAPLP